MLENSPGSRVEGNAVCGHSLGSEAIRVVGDAHGTLIRANFIETGLGLHRAPSSLRMNACGGASPWVVDNNAYALGESTVITATGDCHPVIEANPNIVATKRDYMFNTDLPRGIHCGAANGIASRCVVTTNPNITTQEGPTNPLFGNASTNAGVRAVLCEDGSCARIDHNKIVGTGNAFLSLTRHARLAIGLELGGGRALVNGNVIDSGYVQAGFFIGYGVQFSGNHRFQNNRVTRGLSNTSGGSSEIYSNAVNGLTAFGGSVIRNNTLGFLSATLPMTFENNAVPSGNVSVRTTTASSYTSYALAALEALQGVSASGNLAASCPLTSTGHLSAGSACIDAGTPAGAPRFDFEGDPRGAQPDIGPDEHTP